MDNQSVRINEFDYEIDLRELIGALWLGKFKIIFITTAFAVASITYALSIPNQYIATALLVPAQSSGGLPRTLGNLGGLASLAGINFGGTSAISEGKIAQEIMKSRSYIEDFISENDLAVEIYAAQGWEKGSNELDINSDLYDIENQQWISQDGSGVTDPPSGWLLFQAFSSRLSVSENKKSGMVSISIEYYSPVLAKQWVDMYVESINRLMQKRKVDKITRNIAYLHEQIEKTSITEMREVFYAIIEEQIKSKMLAEASPDYAFVSVGPSMIPEVKSQPKRASICILGTLLGGMLSVLLVLVMHYAKKSD